jgi:hypothetical protein
MNTFIDLTPVRKVKRTFIQKGDENDKCCTRKSNSLKDKPNNININIQNTPYKVLEINCKKGQEKIILSNFPMLK